jgi:hypothetical protein
MEHVLRTIIPVLLILTGCSVNHDRTAVELRANEARMEKFLHQVDSAQKAVDDRFELKRIKESDSIALFLEYKDQRLTEEEKKIHEAIWKLNSVRSIAVSVRSKLSDTGDSLKAVTITDEYRGKDSKFYVVGFYKMDSSTGMGWIASYRMTKDSLIQRYVADKDSWENLHD